MISVSRCSNNASMTLVLINTRILSACDLFCSHPLKHFFFNSFTTNLPRRGKTIHSFVNAKQRRFLGQQLLFFQRWHDGLSLQDKRPKWHAFLSVILTRKLSVVFFTTFPVIREVKEGKNQ